jgi:hypothetical protein
MAMWQHMCMYGILCGDVSWTVRCQAGPVIVVQSSNNVL